MKNAKGPKNHEPLILILGILIAAVAVFKGEFTNQIKAEIKTEVVSVEANQNRCTSSDPFNHSM
jgi:hypothetical protein